MNYDKSILLDSVNTDTKHQTGGETLTLENLKSTTESLNNRVQKVESKKEKSAITYFEKIFWILHTIKNAELRTQSFKHKHNEYYIKYACIFLTLNILFYSEMQYNAEVKCFENSY